MKYVNSVTNRKCFFMINMKSSSDTPDGGRLFRVLSRLFWLIWAAFPVFVWRAVQDIRTAGQAVLAQAPELAGCLDDVPFVPNLSVAGQTAFWMTFAVLVVLLALVLALAHRVIASCARGAVFVGPLVTALWRIGAVIAAFPVIDLAMANALSAFLVRTGDAAAFVPNGAFDLPVFGVGLLLLALARAMREALELRRDADLTI